MPLVLIFNCASVSFAWPQPQASSVRDDICFEATTVQNLLVCLGFQVNTSSCVIRFQPGEINHSNIQFAKSGEIKHRNIQSAKSARFMVSALCRDLLYRICTDRDDLILNYLDWFERTFLFAALNYIYNHDLRIFNQLLSKVIFLGMHYYEPIR